jgi:diguanylate cyclase (GGDEF)-like protein
VKQEAMQQQRQFVRFKTCHAARVRFSEDRIVDCEIRDFSPTGFNLRLPEQSASDNVAPTLGQSSVVVEFSVAGASTTQYFAVEGLVAGAMEGGLRVSANSMSVQAFQAMLDHRASLYRAAGGKTPDGLDPVDIRTIRIQCLSLYRPFLGRVMGEFFGLAGSYGTEAAHVWATPGDQLSFLSALAELQLNQDGIQKTFVESATNRVEQVTFPVTPAMSTLEAEELSLVEEEDFEDWLNLSGVIAKLEAGLQQHLGFFERLYHLLSARVEDQDYDASYFQGVLGQASPFSPDALCRSFQSALQGLKMDGVQRTIFYQLFGRAIAFHGAAFYESLNKVAAVAERRENLPAERRRTGDQRTPEAPPGMVPQPAAAPIYGAGAAAPETMGYSLDKTLTALNTSGLITPSPSRAGAPPAQDVTGYISAGALENSLIHTTGMLQQVVSQLARHVPSFEAPYALTQVDVRTDLPAASTNEILLALDGLLQTRQGERPATWQPSLTEQLRARLAKAGGSNLRIAPEQQQMLDSLASLFDRVVGEYAPASELEALLKRFEAPFFKLALKDPDFLVSDSHPARRVINILDQFAIAADDAGKFFDPRLQSMLATLVDNVIAKADQEPEFYERAAKTLEKMLQPLQKVRRQRIGRLQESSEGKYRVLQSRIRVMNELESRLGGRIVPRILLRLLDNGWRHYLSLLELRLGMEGEEWEIAIGVLDRLLTWLSAEFAPDESYSIQVADLMRRLSLRMATVCVESESLDEMLRELDGLLMSRIQDPKPKLERVHLEPGWLLRGYEREGLDLPKDSKLREQLVLGSWWNIGADGGKLSPMQLIWLSQPPGSCAFANRSATNKREFSIAELDRMKEAGRAEVVTDKELPILERSESAFVDAVYQHLSHQTTHDPVTNLINRRAMMQYLDRKPALAGQINSLFVIEFEQLRVITHQHGMEARDALLRELAAGVLQRLRPDDMLAALGEDSFAGHLAACDAEEGRRIASNIMVWLKTYRYAHGDDSFSIGANVGLVAFGAGSMEAQEALRRADAACLRAKAMGRNQIQLYRADDTEMKGQEDLMEWAGRIDKILDRDGLYLRCQLVSPIQKEAGLKPYYEILLGVRDPDGANVGPQPFIQAVERWNRAHDIDRWVVDNTFHWIRTNAETFAAIGGFSINLSAQSLNNEELLAFLHGELSKADIPVDKIMFEITETGTINSYAAAQEFILQIRRYGCKFCIDDFGSGYASYGHLKNLHTDTLKIDGIFIKDMLQSPADFAMVKSMNEIGHSLGMHVVAEYVATPEILEAVREVGFDYAQGYVLHKPMPIEGLAEAVAVMATSGTSATPAD